MNRVLLIVWIVGLMAGISSATFASDIVVAETGEHFDREAMTVEAGDVVDFVNRDDVTHDITIVDTDGNKTDKGLQKPGQDVKVAFTQRGEYRVYCAISPKLKMTVTVQ